MFMIFPIIWRAAMPWHGLRMQGNCILETRQILGRGPISQEVTAMIKPRARLGCWVMWHQESHTHFRNIYLSVSSGHTQILSESSLPRPPSHSLGLKSLILKTGMISLVLPLLLFFKIKQRDTCNVSEQCLAYTNTRFCHSWTWQMVSGSNGFDLCGEYLLPSPPSVVCQSWSGKNLVRGSWDQTALPVKKATWLGFFRMS